jgi:hypothetical protein
MYIYIDSSKHIKVVGTEQSNDFSDLTEIVINTFPNDFNTTWMYGKYVLNSLNEIVQVANWNPPTTLPSYLQTNL